MTVHARARDHFVRRPVDAVSAAIALVVLVLSMVAVRNGSVSDVERSVFRAVNDLPAALYPVLWPFQQLGAVLVGPVEFFAQGFDSRPQVAEVDFDRLIRQHSDLAFSKDRVHGSWR